VDKTMGIQLKKKRKGKLKKSKSFNKKPNGKSPLKQKK
jgi:hypothetical protein